MRSASSASLRSNPPRHVASDAKSAETPFSGQAASHLTVSTWRNCGSSICFTKASEAANDAKRGGIQIITIAVRDSSTDLGFLFSLNSTNLGFVTESFEEAELVTDAILGEIDIPCPP